MAKKKALYYVEITDILEAEQEDRVIEVIKSYLNKDYQGLKDYFQETDTIQIRKLSKEDADNIVSKLDNLDVVIKVYSQEDKIKDAKSKVTRCPKCGHIMEYPDWRCPECYYEFPDYQFVGDDDSE